MINPDELIPGMTVMFKPRTHWRKAKVLFVTQKPLAVKIKMIEEKVEWIVKPEELEPYNPAE